MPIQVTMPSLSPTMTHGVLARWIAAEGDKIKPGQVIAEIETDKATMEVEAVDQGILAKILIPDGTQDVAVGALLAIILEPGEDMAILDSYIAARSKSGETKVESAQNIQMTKDDVVKSETLSNDVSLNTTSQNNACQLDLAEQPNRYMASPAAKRLAQENNIDFDNIVGSGRGGRIIKTDIITHSLDQTTQPKNLNKSDAFCGIDKQDHTLVPHTMMREVIGTRLLESKRTIPHFYVNIECNITELLSLRSKLNATLKDSQVSINDIIIKATANALTQFPAVNGTWSDEGVKLHHDVDISMAVTIPGGLITPIIRKANKIGLLEISRCTKSLATRARAGSLAKNEFIGGSFSISNLGMYGVKEFYGIINPPQLAILSVGGSEKRPIISGENNEIIVGNMLAISISADHRALDGAIVAEFLGYIKKMLENPLMLSL